MSELGEKIRPIIVKRVNKKKHAFHGGSWKVAFADFATAMMAFFLLLWLVGNTTQEQKQAISGYFQEPADYLKKPQRAPSIIGDGGANNAVIEVQAVTPETRPEILPTETKLTPEELTEQQIALLAEAQEIAKLELLKAKLQALVATSDAFDLFKDQVIVDIIPSGLRIQIVDKDNRPMFDSGSAEPKFHSKIILKRLARVLTSVPNKLSITGHTDATPFVERANYGNWELSSDRANAARRELLYGGIIENKIARVEGFASSILFDDKNPHNPVNRRIAIIVLKASAVEEIEKQVLGIE